MILCRRQLPIANRVHFCNTFIIFPRKAFIVYRIVVISPSSWKLKRSNVRTVWWLLNDFLSFNAKRQLHVRLTMKLVPLRQRNKMLVTTPLEISSLRDILKQRRVMHAIPVTVERCSLRFSQYNSSILFRSSKFWEGAFTICSARISQSLSTQMLLDLNQEMMQRELSCFCECGIIATYQCMLHLKSLLRARQVQWDYEGH